MSNRLAIVAIAAVTAISFSVAVPSIADAAQRGQSSAKSQVQNRPLPNVQRTATPRPASQPRAVAQPQSRIFAQNRVTNRTQGGVAKTTGSQPKVQIPGSDKSKTVVAKTGRDFVKDRLAKMNGKDGNAKVGQADGKNGKTGQTSQTGKVDLKNAKRLANDPRIPAIDAQINTLETQAKILKSTGQIGNQAAGQVMQAQADQLKAAKAAIIAEPGKVEPGKVEPGKVEPGKVEPGKVEPGKVEPGKVEPGKADGKGKPNKVVIIHTGPRHVGPRHFPHYGPVPYYGRGPVAAAPVAAAPARSCLSKAYLPNGPVLFRDTCKNEYAMNTATVAPSPVNPACLTKEYVQPGVVLFKDTCTNEWAMNPPAEQQAQAQ